MLTSETQTGETRITEDFELKSETIVQDVAPHKFELHGFEHPLEMIWYLIKKNDLDIYDIPIAEITEQFLEYLDFAVSVDLASLTDFYVMAADLLLLKSRVLLPVEITFDEEDLEDPRQELVDKLIEYQKFKKLSNLIVEQEDEQEWSFERKKIQRSLPFEDENLWERIDSWDVLQDMQKVFKQLVSSYSSERILDIFEEISVNEKLTLMNELLESNGECFFTDLIIRKGNIMDVVCAFMALLEAVKFKTACIYQNRMFGDIKICPYQNAA